MRLHIVTVAPTPGVVLLAGPADWDSRFLYRTLREVAQLPVRGFVRIEPTAGGRWPIFGWSGARRCARRRDAPTC